MNKDKKSIKYFWKRGKKKRSGYIKLSKMGDLGQVCVLILEWHTRSDSKLRKEITLFQNSDI